MCVGVNWERHGALNRLPVLRPEALMSGRKPAATSHHALVLTGPRAAARNRRTADARSSVNGMTVLGSCIALFQGTEQALSCSPDA